MTNDVVGDPSAPEAWVDSVLEGKHYELTDGVIQESTILEYKSAIHSLKKEELEEGIVKLYDNFLNEIDLSRTGYKFKPQHDVNEGTKKEVFASIEKVAESD